MRLQAFGGLQLTQEGVRVTGEGAQRKRLALLVALAASSRAGMSREKLAVLLWPESDRDRSRNALYQAVAAIRRELGTDVISAGSTGDLTLNSDRIVSDVVDFREAIAARDFAAAVAVYAGPFLDGVYLRGSDEFERWADETRAACATEYCHALRDLATRDTAAGNHSAATEWLRRLAISDPLSASVALQLMDLLAASGEREAAIRHGREYVEHVREELGCAPDARITQRMFELQTSRSLAEVRAPVALVVDPQPASGGTEFDVAGDPAPHAATAVADVGRLAPERLVVGIPLAERPATGRPVPSAARGSNPARFRSRPLIAFMLAAVAVVAAVVAFVRPSRAPSGTPSAALSTLDQRRVVVADFENRTGDSTYNLLGPTLADWVTRGVIEAGLTTVSDPLTRVAVRGTGTAPALGQPGDGATLARAAGAGLVVSGAISRQRQQLVITASITSYPGRQVVFSLQPILTAASDPLGQANELRDRVAGALAAAVDQRVRSITLASSRTPTYAAYQQFVLGLQQFSGNENASVPFFERASNLDTTFVLPLVWAIFAHGNNGRFAQRDSVIRLFSRRTPPPGTLEALHLQYFLARNPEEALQIVLRGAQRSPGSTWSMHAGKLLHDRNRMREAIRYFEQVDVEHSWARGWQTYWLYFSRAQHTLADYAGEYRSALRGLAIEPEDPALNAIAVRALVGMRRTAELHERMLVLLRLLEASGCWSSRDQYEQAALEMRVHGDTVAEGMAMRSWITLCKRELAEPADSLTSGRRLSLGMALYRANILDSAQRVLEQLRRPSSNAFNTLQLSGRLGRIAARRGDRAGAERQMRLLLAGGSKDRNTMTLEFAAIASLLGEQVQAFRALQSASRELHYARLHRDPDYANLWSYPPFVALATPR